MMRTSAVLLLASAISPLSAGHRVTVSMTEKAFNGAIGASETTVGDNGGLYGRVRLYFTRNNDTQPMISAWDGQETGQVFGVDVEDWLPGDEIVIDDSIFGSPRSALSDLDSGDYFMQAELALYDLYKRQNMPEVWLPTSCVSATGDDDAKPDGTLFSAVMQVSLPADTEASLTVSLDRVTPKAKSLGCAGLGDGVESDWVKTVRVQSDLLTNFWGRNITLEACVLIPAGFDDHPDATYPLVISHGHYSPVFWPGGGFQENEPKCDEGVDGYACVQAEYSYMLYQQWSNLTEGSTFSGARMIVATINHPVPFFDDSYAVNSANIGPYGDAIVFELIPAIESRFRAVGDGWARGLYGESTGGWEAIGVQILYPDEFNSAYAGCPDPITFTSYATLNIYNSTNAYYYDSDFKRTPRPSQRDYYSGYMWPGYGSPYGHTVATFEESNHLELVLGTHSRSCNQWDIWEAVFSPVCEDGYPCRMYDKMTGEINKTTAEAWKSYDLVQILAGEWEMLGPKLEGKLHIFVGGSDTYFLNNAVMDMQDFLVNTTNPASDAEIVLGVHNGRGFEHCFRGYEYDENGNALPNSITSLTYNQAFLPEMAEHFAATAPSGADTTSWRY